MKLNNKYYILRHGEAIANVKSLYSSWPEKFKNSMTKKGEGQVKESLRKLKNVKVDFIFSSDLLRTKQTAKIAQKLLKVNPKFDKRLREVDFKKFNGSPASNYFYAHLTSKDEGRENYESVAKRMFGFLKAIDKKYKGKNILIISHQCPLWALANKVNGLTLREGLKIPRHRRIGRGELRELN